METLKISPPASLGLILSYKCNISCRYCIYACSPKWKSDWIDMQDAEVILSELSQTLKKFPYLGQNQISFSYGLHFTGGEPFLNYKLLLELTKIAYKLNIPLPFVETNCFWAKDSRTAQEKLKKLKEAGLAGILISINPFNIENIAFDRIENAYEAGLKVFGNNTIVYQKYYMDFFKSIGLKGKLSFDDFLKKINLKDLYNHIELLPMGRTAYVLEGLFAKYEAREFFGQNCYSELSRNWHVHIDNYRNYIPGFCAGITLGDALELPRMYKEGINLEKYPILKALINDIEKLYKFALEYEYAPLNSGYISKCHLCVDIRKYLVEKGFKFEELKPLDYYSHLLDI